MLRKGLLPGRRCWQLALCCGACILLGHVALGEQNETQAHDADSSAKKTGEILVRGCLDRVLDQFHFASADLNSWVVLTGNTAGLEKYVNQEVVLEGSLGEAIRIEGYDPVPSFKVNRIVRVVEKAEPKLASVFTDQKTWLTETNKKYGVRFAHPDSMDAQEPSKNGQETNFATQEDSEVVASLSIPATAYPNSNFGGGSFTIFVNRHVTNRGTCMQFGQSRAPEESYAVGKHLYAKADGGGGGMGTWYGYDYFHVFQNGVCYELAVELIEFNARAADTGCNIPILSEEDNWNLIRPLIAGVSFLTPTVQRERGSDTRLVPQVTDFSASSQTADGADNRGLITFSWKTRDADYVELAYTCLDPANAEEGGVSSIVISEDGPNRYCQNTASFKTYSTGPINHSPNSSANIGFGYFFHDDPTSVIVTITPFSHGTPYPVSSRSLTITINPYNPFPRGIPTQWQNMTLAYNSNTDGTVNYPQGSPLTITWTDERTQDPCVNLYLVQDSPIGGEIYLLQINGKRETGCLKPASRGSYTWTVTTKFVGSGFRVLATTPGGTSGKLGAPFNIVKPAPNFVP